MAVRIPPRLWSPAFLTAAAGRAESTVALNSCRGGGGVSGRPMSPPPRPPPASYTTLKDRCSCEQEIKRSKFIAIAAPISDERSAHSFLAEVQDPRATHNCWAYKLGDQYRCNDDGEPSGTAGKPIYSAICSSGIDMVMVVVIRHFGGIKLGTGGLVRAYGGVASECLKGATTFFVKPKVPIGIEVPFELLGTVYHQLQFFKAEDINQDYDTGKDSFTLMSFKIDYEKIESLEDAVNSACSRKLQFYKR